MNLLENIDNERINTLLNDNVGNTIKGINSDVPDFIYTIEDFTMLPDIVTTENMLQKSNKSMFENQYGIDLKNIRYSKSHNCYHYFSLKNNIFFDKLSNQIENENMKKELTSSNRYSKCHEMSIKLSDLYSNSSVVTGFITVGNCRILHSVLKINRNNHEYIIDYTKNLIMLEKDYTKIYKYITLTNIKNHIIKKDLKSLEGYYIEPKLYLSLHDEIMDNFERHTK